MRLAVLTTRIDCDGQSGKRVAPPILPLAFASSPHATTFDRRRGAVFGFIFLRRRRGLIENLPGKEKHSDSLVSSLDDSDRAGSVDFPPINIQALPRRGKRRFSTSPPFFNYNSRIMEAVESSKSFPRDISFNR